MNALLGIYFEMETVDPEPQCSSFNEREVAEVNDVVEKVPE